LATKSKHKTYLLRVDDLDIPVKIYKERRNSIRASLGKNHAILRLPLFLSKKEEKVQIDRFYLWLKDKVLVDDRFRRRFESKDYKSGYTFELYDRSYHLSIVGSDNKNHSAKYLGNGEIRIKLAAETDPGEAEKEISALISRVIGKVYIEKITQRVHFINDTYYGKDIRTVKLKYNRSNWGSCSTSSNINLSTRLLFAPEAVQDYVIIHELAHLIEMNHSARFWDIVRRVMPNYKQAEKWLKMNGHKCDF